MFEMKVMIYGGAWASNIGDAFINLGCEAFLRETLPDEEIQICSVLPRWLRSRGSKRKRVRPNRIRRVIDEVRATLGWSDSDIPVDNGNTSAGSAIDLAEISDFDLLVVFGVACCESFPETRGDTLRQVRDRGIPILLLGVGGSEYTERERVVVSQFLKELAPLAFISRDEATLNAYGACSPLSHGGIDNAFFAPSAFRPLPIGRDFVARCFDTMEDPDSASANAPDVIRLWHSVLSPLPGSMAEKSNLLVSDMPYDYLSV
jgi:hypothetical protein